jgi:hypothetical protein
LTTSVPKTTRRRMIAAIRPKPQQWHPQPRSVRRLRGQPTIRSSRWARNTESPSGNISEAMTVMKTAWRGVGRRHDGPARDASEHNRRRRSLLTLYVELSRGKNGDMECQGPVITNAAAVLNRLVTEAGGTVRHYSNLLE